MNSETQPQPITPEQKHIYIVDDDISICRALGILLSTYGFTTTTFACAEDFLSTVPNSEPGCLLLDINLPGLNGWETQQFLLDSGSKRPVIFISSDEERGLIRRIYQTGALGYLQKPFKEHQLFDLLHLVS